MKKEVHMSNQLLNKYAEIISSLKASNGIKIISVEENKDNGVDFSYPAQPSRSRLRYWMASARCSTRMSSLSAMSAMVRATLRMRS